MRVIALGLLLLAGCPSKPPTTTGTGSGSGPGSNAGTSCEGIRAKVEGMYRDEAKAKEPERVDEATADNTAMVLGECNRDPGRVVPCVEHAQSIDVIEKTCLSPLDEEGSEGEALRK